MPYYVLIYFDIQDTHIQGTLCSRLGALLLNLKALAHLGQQASRSVPFNTNHEIFGGWLRPLAIPTPLHWVTVRHQQSPPLS